MRGHASFASWATRSRLCRQMVVADEYYAKIQAASSKRPVHTRRSASSDSRSKRRGQKWRGARIL
eukprot:618639-Alexandrium_andersonii.AAC.1